MLKLQCINRELTNKKYDKLVFVFCLVSRLKGTLIIGRRSCAVLTAVDVAGTLFDRFVMGVMWAVGSEMVGRGSLLLVGEFRTKI